jgi:2-oxoglutarate dehydrogenase complex dehydrogenase (E1) component-like enzyme
MARQDQNEALLQTSFLYGANASYIEDLYARYQDNPNSVDAEWRNFFGALNDDAASVTKSAQGASWQRKNWPIAANGELVSALDGNWGAVEKIVSDKLKGKAEAKADSTDRTRAMLRAPSCRGGGSPSRLISNRSARPSRVTTPRTSPGLRSR